MNIPHFETRSAKARLTEHRFVEHSMAKLLRQLANDETPDGVEGEVETHFGGGIGTGNLFGRTFTLPWNLLGRDLSTNVPSAGGALVGYTVGPAADVLRPYNMAARAGMTIFSGLRGDLAIPSVLDEVEFTWLTEGGSGPSLTPGTGLAMMTPHSACGLISFPGRLLRLQPPAVFDVWIRRRLLQAAGQLIDRVVLNGRSNSDGSALADNSAEPLGLCNISDVAQFTGDISSGTVLSSGINPAMTCVASRAGTDEGASFIMSPGVRQQLLPNYPNEPGALRDNLLQGRATHCTSAMPATKIAYGDWGNAALALFGEGVELAVDPFTNFKNDVITMRCWVTMDVAFNSPASFAVATVAP